MVNICVLEKCVLPVLDNGVINGEGNQDMWMGRNNLYLNTMTFRFEYRTADISQLR